MACMAWVYREACGTFGLRVDADVDKKERPRRTYASAEGASRETEDGCQAPQHLTRSAPPTMSSPRLTCFRSAVPLDRAPGDLPTRSAPLRGPVGVRMYMYMHACSL
jgi:hypothetical protein